ncbi:hypothetical protein PF001_g31638 [Phytophthora fragariae]|uniref:HTH CENPB-type domain-containing protein n=3 Tax=Phytophthora fragariae TaxID=53985 RepID=A0A6A4AYW0_9STRA|nr:hypothetical protein PF001_g31638 [Phytophthora fragariae]
MGRWMTIEQKRKLVAKAAECPQMTQEKRAEATFSLANKPARNTISDILRKADLLPGEPYQDGKRRKPLKVASLRLEKRLSAWIQEQEARNICLSRELIEMRARELQGELCDAWDLSFSDGWMTAFMCRHGLRFRVRHGEAASVDPQVVHEGLQRLQAVTDLYEPRDIYNVDETGLCYAMAPARSIGSKNMCGVKKQKTRITLALTANADGSDALPILYIGKAKKPRCFGKQTPEQHGFQYRSNKKAWMTGDVFRDWLINLDRDMRASGRHILLLLDNASSHSSGNLVLTNVRLEPLPPNTTAFLQPMDAGVIADFKRSYRKKQLRWVYQKIKRREPITGDAYKVSQLVAMQWCDEIWAEIAKKNTIRNCFRHTGTLFAAVAGHEWNADNQCTYGEDMRADEIILRASELHL